MSRGTVTLSLGTLLLERVPLPRLDITPHKGFVALTDVYTNNLKYTIQAVRKVCYQQLFSIQANFQVNKANQH